MTIAEIENYILNKLKSDITNYAVELYPEDVKNYVLTHPNGAILISFEGANYTTPRLDQMMRMMEFSVIIIARNLRSHLGAYGVLDRVRQSLTNDFFIYNSRPYPLTERFLFIEDDKWFFEIRFVIPLIHFIGE